LVFVVVLVLVLEEMEADGVVGSGRRRIALEEEDGDLLLTSTCCGCSNESHVSSGNGVVHVLLLLLF
jgi:hypothetical protein